MPTNFGVPNVILKPSDYVAGQETGVIPVDINVNGDWGFHLPLEENQQIMIGGIKYETGGCTNFSFLNVIETILNFKMANKILSEAVIIKCKNLGYIDESGKFNFSDRFLYKMSGTTIKGNQVINSPDTINKFGLLPEKMWPATGLLNFEEFTKGIPVELQTYAKQFLGLFEIKYDWVVLQNCGAPDIEKLKGYLKQSPLVSVHAFCGADASGTVQVCQGCNQQHATTLYGIDDGIRIFDSVFASKKKFALTYPIIWALRTTVIEKQTLPVPVVPSWTHTFYENLEFGQKSTEVKWLQKALVRLGYTIPVDNNSIGYFGEWTRAANENFQRENGVWNPLILYYDQSKYVGPKTRAMLNKKLKV